MKLTELKKIMKENKIRGSSHMNKPEIIASLLEKSLIASEALKNREPIIQEVDPKYDFIRSIRNNPKSVEIQNLATGEITRYPSIYKASRSLGSSTTIIIKNNGKKWRGYEIKILEK